MNRCVIETGILFHHGTPAIVTGHQRVVRAREIVQDYRNVGPEAEGHGLESVVPPSGWRRGRPPPARPAARRGAASGLPPIAPAPVGTGTACRAAAPPEKACCLDVADRGALPLFYRPLGS